MLGVVQSAYLDGVVPKRVFVIKKVFQSAAADKGCGNRRAHCSIPVLVPLQAINVRTGAR